LTKPISNHVGGDGDDVLFGDAGTDGIYGQAGEDFIEGGAGDDYVTPFIAVIELLVHDMLAE
jgi:hypothetical protein